jgi:RNA polymerase sigma-70 factor (ECF subfamily)
MNSDAELIVRYKGGDEDAFEDLVRRYLDSVYNYARRYVRNTTDAEDVTQEVFVKA